MALRIRENHQGKDGIGRMNTQNKTSMYAFTFFGFLLVIVALVAFGKGGGGKVTAMFLGVLLLSMILLNWATIQPLILKKQGG